MSSSDLHVYDAESQFLPDPFFPFNDAHINDILQAISNIIPDTQNPDDGYNSTESEHHHQLSKSLLSSSPPCHQLQSMSLYQANQLQPSPNASNFSNGIQILGGYEANNEEFHVGRCESLLPHSYGGHESMGKYMQMQRSYSSNSVVDAKPLVFQPLFDALLESSADYYQNQAMSSPDNGLLGAQMRRACSAGDLQSVGTGQSTPMSSSSSFATESSCIEEANVKVGRYSAEERKERILKYRAKRTQRNFNKTIKYACRKTLADSRPRIRGRFARNDEIGDLPKVESSIRDEEDDELWLGMHEEDEYRVGRGGAGAAAGGVGTFFSTYGQTQFQYY